MATYKLFERLTPLQPAVDGSLGDVEPSRPFGLCHHETLALKGRFVASVLVALGRAAMPTVLAARHPRAGLRAVDQAADATLEFLVQLVPFGALTHVFQEVRKGLPAWAVGDSSPAVAGIADVSGVVATRLHRVPSAIGAALSPTSSVPVLES